MSYLEVYMVDGHTLLEAATPFPEATKMLRKRIIRWALRREFIRVGRLARKCSRCGRYGGYGKE